MVWREAWQQKGSRQHPPFDSDGSGKLSRLKDVSNQRDVVADRLQPEWTELDFNRVGSPPANRAGIKE
jgi:hypothetical protein